ncbi:MAG: hypothetical protein COT74_10115 [Bdellovibrionales bacterium CG10_big_fil_rev_8_21_14_0_10_45_34]|nr:MAG: hypothetical protein COT74_10115 [Bdellovibrionales bacterium CG10_big_fil_rev_8_21_14_0_10_45_34]
MPTISFQKSLPSIEVPKGKKLMDALFDAGIPVASSCGGVGSCTKCRITIIEGSQNLSLPNELEEDLREMYEIPTNERVSCQTEVLGDIRIDTSYW